MQINMILNGKRIQAQAEPDELLIDFVRKQGCLSVKRGCETSNCGLCTVFLEDKPVLSCSVLALRAEGKRVATLEGLQEEAAQFAVREVEVQATLVVPLTGKPLQVTNPSQHQVEERKQDTVEMDMQE